MDLAVRLVWAPREPTPEATQITNHALWNLSQITAVRQSSVTQQVRALEVKREPNAPPGTRPLIGTQAMSALTEMLIVGLYRERICVGGFLTLAQP